MLSDIPTVRIGQAHTAVGLDRPYGAKVVDGFDARRRQHTR